MNVISAPVGYWALLVDFILVLYWKFLSDLRGFWESLRNKVSVAPPFLHLFPFVSFPCHTVVAQASSTILTMSEETGYPCLHWDFQGKALSFPVVWCSQCIIFIEPLSCGHTFLKLLASWVFLIKGCWTLWRLSEHIKVIMWFISLSQFMYCIIFLDLHMWNQVYGRLYRSSCYPFWEATLISVSFQLP